MLGLKEMKCNPCDCLVLNQSQLGKDRSKHIVGCCRTIVDIHLWVLKKNYTKFAITFLEGKTLPVSLMQAEGYQVLTNSRTRSRGRHRCLCPRCARPSRRYWIFGTRMNHSGLNGERLTKELTLSNIDPAKGAWKIKETIFSVYVM